MTNIDFSYIPLIACVLFLLLPVGLLPFMLQNVTVIRSQCYEPCRTQCIEQGYAIDYERTECVGKHFVEENLCVCDITTKVIQ